MSSIFITIFSYPIYLTLYTLEHISSYKEKDLTKKKLLRFNMPESDSTKKVWMDSIASIATLLSLSIAIRISHIIGNQELELEMINKIFSGTFISSYIAVAILLCIAILYCISYCLTQVDTRTAYQKIVALSIPALLLKQFQIDIK
ncbi:hypothetical protein [Sulfurimonas sp.]